jgi:hypothetical protein
VIGSPQSEHGFLTIRPLFTALRNFSVAELFHNSIAPIITFLELKMWYCALADHLGSFPVVPLLCLRGFALSTGSGQANSQPTYKLVTVHWSSGQEQASRDEVVGI